MNAKSWLKAYFIVISVLFFLFYIFIIIADAQYPLRITDSISFDEKLRFLKKTDRLSSSNAVIVGSSLGFYNLDDELLEDESRVVKELTNLSSWGLQTTQLEFVLRLLEDNEGIKYVIYPTQVLDFAFDKSFDVDADELKKYINNEFTLYLYNRVFLNAYNFLKALYNFNSLHQVKDTYSSLLFNRTGGGVYKIYGDNISKKRWNDTRVFGLNRKNFDALGRIAKLLNAKQIKFIVATLPVRKAPLQKTPALMKQYYRFAGTIQTQAKRDGFYYINLHKILSLGDAFFVDSTHLNAEGAAISARKVAQYIDRL